MTVRELISSVRLTKLWQAFVIGIGVGIFLIPWVVWANAAPPPPLSWFDFQSEVGPLESVQVLQCDSKQCPQPILIAQFGLCSLPECLNRRPANQPTQTYQMDELSCRGRTCLLLEGGNTPGSKGHRDLRLQVQSKGRLWRSPVFSELGQIQHAWQVSRLDSSLHVISINVWERQEPPALFWGKGLVLTLVTEALMLALALKLMRSERKVWYRTFFSFGLMHLVTYPLVWALPLGLIPFQTKMARVFAIGALFIAFIDLLILFLLRKTSSWKLGVGSLLGLPLAFLAAIILTLLLSYGQSVPLTTGTSFNIALGLTEAIVVLFEAVFLRILSYDILSFRQTGLLSLSMNSVSLLAGLVLWRFWL